jgi:hypothetical protein
MRSSVSDHSGRHWAHVSLDSEQTDSEFMNSSSSSESHMTTSVFPSIRISFNDENVDVGSFGETESPVPASAKVASPLRASIIVGEQGEINEDIPQAAPVPVVADTLPEQRQPLPLDIENVFRPIPQESGRVKCYIRRNSMGRNHSHPIYSMFAEEGDRFIMSAKRVSKKLIISKGEIILYFFLSGRNS